MIRSLRKLDWYLVTRGYHVTIGILALCIAWFLMSDSASAATTVPVKMNFQGRLTDNSGNIKTNGNYNMKIRIYDASTGGTLRYYEERLVSAGAPSMVPVTNGLFSIKIGDGSNKTGTFDATIFASGDLYVEVELPTPATATSSSPVWSEGAMTPRSQMLTSAYAYNAETLDGIDGASFAQKGTTNTFTAAQTVNVSSTGAFDIQNGSAVSVFKVNTSGASVTIGTSDTTGTIFVLDTKTDAGDPTGQVGAMYYNSNAGKFRCYQGAAWTDCIGSAGGGDVYLANANTFTNTNTIATTSATAFRIQTTSGTTTLLTADTSAMAVTLNGNLSLTTGKTITLAGDTTLNRPTGAEGRIYYDTDTKQLMTYSNGKWQADRSDAVLVAANNSSAADKAAADYIADGNTVAALDGDQVQIQSALTAGTGKKVVLLAGTYVADATILIPNNTTLAGVGWGTLVELADLDATDNLIENSNTSTGTGVIIRDFKIDGRKDLNTAGTQNGIVLNGMGSGTGSSGRQGGQVNHVSAVNFRTSGIVLTSSSNNSLISNISQGNSTYGFETTSSSNYNTFSANAAHGNDTGFRISSVSNNTFTNNTATGNGTSGFTLISSSYVTLSGNSTLNNVTGIILSSATRNSIIGNTSQTERGVNLINANLNVISGNTITDGGGSTANDAIKLDASDSNTITSNNITDSSATTTNYAIDISNSTSDTNTLSNNTLGGGTVNDLGTGTIYANQISSTGVLTNRATGFAIQSSTGGNILSNNSTTSVTIGASDTTGTLFVLDTKTDAGDPTGIAGGMYYNSNLGKFRCYQVSAWTDCIAAGGGATLGANTFTGAQVINVSSTAALDVQNGSAVSVFKVDSSTSTVTIGTATNGTVFTSTGLTFNGTARPTRTATLVPEYQGATFRGDGTNNNGSLSSDFCSSTTGGLAINTAVCSAANQEHNYYEWANTQATAQDYDLYVRYQLPADYSTGSMTNLTFTAHGGTTSEAATLTMHSAGTQCATSGDVVTSAGTWQTGTVASPLGSCTPAANGYIVFKIVLSATLNNQVRAGAIGFTYRSTF